MRTNEIAHARLMEGFKKSMNEYKDELSDTELADIATLTREDVVNAVNKIEEVIVKLQTGDFNVIDVKEIYEGNGEAVQMILWALFSKLEITTDEIIAGFQHKHRPFIPRIV